MTQLFYDTYTGVIVGRLINRDDFNHVNEIISNPKRKYINSSNAFIVHCMISELQYYFINYFKDKCKPKDDIFDECNTILLFPLLIPKNKTFDTQLLRLYISQTQMKLKKILSDVDINTCKVFNINNALAIECTSPEILNNIINKIDISTIKNI
jgi:hypothetical protein